MQNPRLAARAGVPAIVAALLATAGTASAIDKNWNNPAEGPYSDGANWVDATTGAPTSAPTSSDNAFIGVTTGIGTTTGTATNAEGETAEANFITIGRDPDSSGGLIITGGVVRPRFDIYVGGFGPPTFNGNVQQNGTGFVTQSGGAVTASNMQVGMGANGEGVYTMSGGTLYFNNIATSGGNPVTSVMAIGGRALAPSALTARILDDSIDAAFNQSGGDVIVEDFDPSVAQNSILNLGRTGGGANSGRAAGDNAYNLSGGRLAVPIVAFGNNVTGVTENAGSNTFTLSGTGLLSTRSIEFRNTSAANSFNFNGGTLTVNSVGTAASPISLINNGGTLSPGRGGPLLDSSHGESDFTGGNEVGTTAITGSYSQNAAGRLVIDVNSAGADQVTAGGTVGLNGALDIRTEEGLAAAFQRYDIVTGTSRGGEFSSVNGSLVNNDVAYAVVYDGTGADLVRTLPGDATLDGTVNVADLGVLATFFNQNDREFTEGNFNGDNAVNVADLGLLATNFGRSVVGQATGMTFDEAMALPQFADLAAAVPEPTSLAVLALAGAGLLGRRRR